MLYLKKNNSIKFIHVRVKFKCGFVHFKDSLHWIKVDIVLLYPIVSLMKKFQTSTLLVYALKRLQPLSQLQSIYICLLL